MDAAVATSSDAAGPTKRVVRAIETAMEIFDRHVRPPAPHGNQRLHLRGVLGILLAAAFDPAVRSLRTIDDLSLLDEIQTLSGVPRVARSTLSDSLAKFDPEFLAPMVAALGQRLPQLERLEPRLAQLTRKIIAGDGSWFNLCGQVIHALHCRRGNKGTQYRIRLNLQLDVDGFCPTAFDVSGKGDGNEARAFERNLQSDCIYLFDRNFVSFHFFNALLEAKSSFVVRFKKKVNFQVRQSNEVSEQDREHGVLRDEVGVLGGPQSAGNGDARSCSDKPPQCLLRRVTIWDQNNQCEIELITDMLDVAAHIIGLLYRLRWQIELFFRWLKVLANFRHLISQSEHGISMQFYIAVLMALLISVQTGSRVSKYGLLWLGWVASGRATAEAMAQAMARHERERENERKRRAKKSAK